MGENVERAVERILIVNDNGESVAKALSGMLVRGAASAGAGNYEVVTAVLQIEGLEKYVEYVERGKPFDAVLTNLPEFAAKIRAMDETSSSGRRTVTIGTTGSNFKEREERVFDKIVQLPVDTRELVNIVRNLLDQRALGRKSISASALQSGAQVKATGEKIKGTV